MWTTSKQEAKCENFSAKPQPESQNSLMLKKKGNQEEAVQSKNSVACTVNICLQKTKTSLYNSKALIMHFSDLEKRMLL